jgi:hypothetical protein
MKQVAPKHLIPNHVEILRYIQKYRLQSCNIKSWDNHKQHARQLQREKSAQEFYFYCCHTYLGNIVRPGMRSWASHLSPAADRRQGYQLLMGRKESQIQRRPETCPTRWNYWLWSHHIPSIYGQTYEYAGIWGYEWKRKPTSFDKEWCYACK